MTDQLRTKIIRSQAAKTCPGCGDDKIRGQSFCYACFELLPRRMQQDLTPAYSRATTIQGATLKAADYLATKGITAPSSIFVSASSTAD